MTTANPRFDLTSLGEVMLRLSVGQGEKLVNAERFDVNLGGAEANVCAALAGLGRKTAWLGAFPDSPLGELALRSLRANGVDVAGVKLVANARLGTYFVELGAPPNPIDVIYDRAGSAAANMTPNDVDWELMLDTRWLHLTGITPALGEGPAAIVEQALRLAAERGVKVVFDVNFRAKLWSASAAKAWLEPRLGLVDLLICGVQDAATVLGLNSDPLATVRALAQSGRGDSAVVTLGDKGAIAWERGRQLRVPGVAAEVIDRLGAGDAFAAGVIDGLLDDSLHTGLERGVTLAAAALGQHGDVVNLSREALDRLLAGDNKRPAR